MISIIATDRALTAVHEAGHTVAIHLTGQHVLYATIRPDGKAVGHVQSRDQLGPHPHLWYRTPAWLNLLTGGAAGMAAVAALLTDIYGTLDHDRLDLRGEVMGHGGLARHGDSADMRHIARAVWHSARAGDDYLTPQELARIGPINLGPHFNPAWASDPAGVEAIAGVGWAHAVRLVCEHWAAVVRVAGLLISNPRRRVHRPELLAAIAAASHDNNPGPNPARVGTDFWLPEYTRMVWRPAGHCRPRTRAAA